jgi:hypothetical protein
VLLRVAGGRWLGRQLEVEEAAWFAHVEGGEDAGLAWGGGRALSDSAFGGGHGDEVHAVEFVADVAPRVAGGVLRRIGSERGLGW